ncbi:MAG: efflux RND transporter periplasmic adaptor subunit [Candidatus Cyclobacteriaceae bacterium M2_1C_046]
MATKKKKSNKTIYILLGLLAVIVLLAIIGSTTGIIGKEKEIEVEIAEASKTAIVEKVSASGMIQPVTEVKLSPDVAGEIIELNVQEGDSVRAGDFLVKIRPDNWINALERARASLNQQRANLTSAQASLEKAKANMERALAEYNRQEQLWEEKVISEAEWQQAKQSYQAARNDLKAAEQQVVASGYIVKSSEASLEEAQENVRLTSVIAPMSGTVSKLSVEKGERVVGTQQMAGTELMRIADLDSMEVRVDVNENDIIRIEKGDTVLIDVDAYSHLDKEFKGIVTAIANTANEKTSPDAVTEFEVRITILKNSYRDLINEGMRYPFKPGMTASVDIITERKENTLAVPLSAVTTRNTSDIEDQEGTQGNRNQEVREVVFVLKDGKAILKEVETGISDYDVIEIKEGLEAGEEIITGPFLIVSKRLKDGDPVKVKENQDSN